MTVLTVEVFRGSPLPRLRCFMAATPATIFEG
jgi:hypothetical protein